MRLDTSLLSIVLGVMPIMCVPVDHTPSQSPPQSPPRSPVNQGYRLKTPEPTLQARILGKFGHQRRPGIDVPLRLRKGVEHVLQDWQPGIQNPSVEFQNSLYKPVEDNQEIEIAFWGAPMEKVGCSYESCNCVMKIWRVANRPNGPVDTGSNIQPTDIQPDSHWDHQCRWVTIHQPSFQRATSPEAHGYMIKELVFETEFPIIKLDNMEYLRRDDDSAPSPVQQLQVEHPLATIRPRDNHRLLPSHHQ
ncbi:hypothetical protein EV361DRAFT_893484 [Lentinula raphanica]|nr:hypothetical protein EV361DRAFT_893484 [Lentinula raphanica]